MAGGILAIVYRARVRSTKIVSYFVCALLQAESLVRSTLNSTLILYGVNSTEGRATTEAWDRVQQEVKKKVDTKGWIEIERC